MPTNVESTTDAPVSVTPLETIRLDTLHPDDVVQITTRLDATYVVRLDPMVGSDNPEKISILAKNPSQSAEHPQHAQVTVTVGEPWEMSSGHKTSEITAIHLLRPSA